MKHSTDYEYMIFGSKSSIDFDVIIKVPIEYLNNKPNVLLAQNLIMDKYFSNYLNSLHNDEKSNKVVNSCFGYWENGLMIACQKGSVEETNNAIITTFGYHQKYQMYDQCPLVKFLPRDLKSKQMKIMGGIRMIVSTLSHSNFIQDNTASIRKILTSIILIPEFQTLDQMNIDMFKILCLKIVDLKKSVINTCQSNLIEFDAKIIQNKHQELLKIRHQHSILLRSFKFGATSCSNLNDLNSFLDRYFELRSKSAVIVEDIVNIIMTNEDRFTKEFIQSVKNDVQGCMLTLKPITSFILKVKYLCFQSEYICMFDFSQLELFTDKEDKYKKLAFQIGQSLALLNGIEVFEKETIAKVYPQLHNFLFRLPISHDDWQNFNKLVAIFAREIYAQNIVQRNFIELEMI